MIVYVILETYGFRQCICAKAIINKAALKYDGEAKRQSGCKREGERRGKL